MFSLHHQNMMNMSPRFDCESLFQQQRLLTAAIHNNSKCHQGMFPIRVSLPACTFSCFPLSRQLIYFISPMQNQLGTSNNPNNPNDPNKPNNHLDDANYANIFSRVSTNQRFFVYAEMKPTQLDRSIVETTVCLPIQASCNA